MRLRNLGSTGIRVSEIGFGAWGIGGDSGGALGYGPVDDRESVRAIRVARERGVNFFDTSDLYGFGHSESVLGSALRGERQQVVIASKAGMLGAGDRQDFSPEHLRAALEESLRRLDTDYLDLLQLHSPPLEALRGAPEVLEALDQLRREGKIRAYGISARSPEDALAAVREFRFASVQVNFSLADQRALDNGLMELCQQTGAGVIARTPLCFGFLTGKYDAATAFHGSDHRNRWSSDQRKLWAAAPDIFVAALGSVPSQTPAQLALRFCLSFDAVCAAIPGMQKVSEVEENTQAGNLGALGPEEREALRDAYRKHRFFIGAA